MGLGGPLGRVGPSVGPVDSGIVWLPRIFSRTFGERQKVGVVDVHGLAQEWQAESDKQQDSGAGSLHKPFHYG